MTNKQNFRHELKYRITQAYKDIMMARLDMFLAGQSDDALGRSDGACAKGPAG